MPSGKASKAALTGAARKEKFAMSIIWMVCHSGNLRCGMDTQGCGNETIISARTENGHGSAAGEDILETRRGRRGE